MSIIIYFKHLLSKVVKKQINTVYSSLNVGSKESKRDHSTRMDLVMKLMKSTKESVKIETVTFSTQYEL